MYDVEDVLNGRCEAGKAVVESPVSFSYTHLPAAVSDAVGHVGEFFGAVQEIVVEHALLDDLAVQLRHAVDGMAHIAADVGHAHLAVAQNGHVVDLALVAGEGALQVGADVYKRQHTRGSWIFIRI